MKLLKWSENYAVGIPAVDHEHREMIELINTVFSSLRDNADAESIERTLGEIHAGIAAHFALEERFMRRARYKEYKAHKADHEELLDQIGELMDVFADDPDAGREQLRRRLGDWFGEHFGSFDARLHRRLGSHP